jgi:hypothetical protein
MTADRCPNFLILDGDRLRFNGEWLSFGLTDCEPELQVEFSLSRRVRMPRLRRITRS